KYQTSQACPSCHGSRLRQESRHVFIGQTNLPTITHMSIGEAMDFFEGLKLTGQRGQIAEKILKEIRDRLSFLINVGL
ncbi:hypothetical protein, partial [Pseudoalteromonas sp. GW168-MNA-CIBAN-0100]